jgi:benzoylformate decarboxylase
MAARTVRDATFDLLRRRGLDVLFANPGSTEVPFLTDLPDDLRFVLALHENAVVGLASGYAIARDAPALVLIHTTAGLGNAVGALATARVNRAPLVVIVGQQDRRHLAAEPFLAGRLAGLAGDYPVWVEQPIRPQDVPGAIGRAEHEATVGRGPAIVIVPMDDWTAPADDLAELTPAEVVAASRADPAAVERVAAVLGEARSPAIVVGAGADGEESWAALVDLAERLVAPVWQESFGARAGFPQDHRLFAGHLPADRTRLRATLAPYDVVLTVGAAAFRQYPYDDGPFVEPGTRLLLVSDDPAEVNRSPVELALLAPVAATCAELARAVPARNAEPPPAFARPGAPPDGPLRAGHVLAALAERLPAEAVVVEETPSSRPELHARLAARRPGGFVSAAMGGLGFALAASAGLRLANPERPVVAVVGDGAAVFGIQSLWSAKQYGAGVLYIVLANGGYAVMDRLAERHGGRGPWPRFDDVDVAAMARSFGCDARRVETEEDLLRELDDVVPTLAARDRPLLLEVIVEPDETFAP